MFQTFKSIFMPYPETKEPWPWQYALLAWLKFYLKLNLLNNLTLPGVVYFVEGVNFFAGLQIGYNEKYSGFYGSQTPFISALIYFLLLPIYFYISCVVIYRLFHKIIRLPETSWLFIIMNIFFFVIIFLLNIRFLIYSFEYINGTFFVFIYTIFSLILLLLCQMPINHYLHSLENKPSIAESKTP